ncbi:Retrotransposon gag domain-containing 1 [Gossypium australe]|uniref:Retrotransposon gag domain-containing 1 n=1 Tax=Gossypium australe TaxID=47621 RepID=A0A5B6VUI0_9ROSI|nr:Retrotransposon gag domain-containing 1 [Gossypium australe]
MDPERAVIDDVESNAPVPAQGAAPSDTRPVSSSHEGEAKEAFFQMMSEWFTEFVRTNPAAPQPPHPPIPQQILIFPQVIDPIRLNKPLIDKIRKYGVEEFRATVDDDAERDEFWLENTIRVFDELSCTPKECIKCLVSLLRDNVYHWWKMLISMVSRERVGVTEYEREFVRLIKYAKEYVSTKKIMCKRFVDGLNEDIKLLVGILKLKEFIVLVERACKVEDLSKEKRKVDSEARYSRKRSMNKPYHSS